MTIIECNFTKTPNAIVDTWLPHLSGSATKVLLFLTRKTIGFHKQSDLISISQIIKGTGLSKNSVASSLKDLLNKKLITKVASKINGIDQCSEFGISENCVKQEIKEKFNESKNDMPLPVERSKIHLGGRSKIDPTKEIFLKEKERLRRKKEKSAPSEAPVVVFSCLDSLEGLKKDSDKQTISKMIRNHPSANAEELVRRIIRTPNVRSVAALCVHYLKNWDSYNETETKKEKENKEFEKKQSQAQERELLRVRRKRRAEKLAEMNVFKFDVDEYVVYYEDSRGRKYKTEILSEEFDVRMNEVEFEIHKKVV